MDEGDNDSARFISYLVAALQTISASIGEGVLAVVQSPQQPPIEAPLTTLLTELAVIQDPFILALDDYHLINDQRIDAAVANLVKYLPLQMHLVTASRDLFHRRQAAQAALLWLSHIVYIIHFPISFWVIVPLMGLALGFIAWRARDIFPAMLTHSLVDGLPQLITGTW